MVRVACKDAGCCRLRLQSLYATTAVWGWKLHHYVCVQLLLLSL